MVALVLVERQTPARVWSTSRSLRIRASPQPAKLSHQGEAFLSVSVMCLSVSRLDTEYSRC